MILLLSQECIFCPPILDTQSTCVFVWLKKGIEKTLSIVDEVIQKVKDALTEECGRDIVPKDCFVSLKVNCMCTCMYTTPLV